MGLASSCLVPAASVLLPCLALPASCLPFALLPGAVWFAWEHGGLGELPLPQICCLPFLEASDPTAVSSLCFFQVWGQILTAIACPLPSLLPPSPPYLLPPMPAEKWHPLVPGSLSASSMAPSLS